MFFCSFSYQILILRAIGEKGFSEIVLQSIIVGIYIIGLGIGSAMGAAYPRLMTIKVFILSETLLCLLGGLASTLIQMNYIVLHEQAGIVSALLPFSLTFLVAFLSGIEMPFFSNNRVVKSESNWHLIIGFSYFGCFVASFVVPFWLLPKFGLMHASLLVGLLNLFTALLYCQGLPNRKINFIFPIMAFAMIGFVWSQSHDLEKFLTKATYVRLGPSNTKWRNLPSIVRLIQRSPNIERIESPIQTIDIQELGGKYDDFVLFLNERVQFHSHNQEVYHQWMAHVPHEGLGLKPRKVLVLGGGDGLLVKELLRLPFVEKIDLVEIDAKMIELANTHPRFLKINEGALKAPKVKVFEDDAFAWVRQTSEKYDAIYVDFPFPYLIDLSRLYSKEFYNKLLFILNEDGYVCLDFPVRESMRDLSLFNNVDKIVSTIHYAGGQGLLAYGWNDDFIVFQKNAKTFSFRQAYTSSLLSDKSRARLRDLSSYTANAEVSEKLVNSIFAPTIFGRKNY